MTTHTPVPPYPPTDEADVKVHYWPEYVELPGDSTFTTDYRDQLDGAKGRGGVVGFHVMGRCPRCRCRTSDVFPLQVVGPGAVDRARASDPPRGEFGAEVRRPPNAAPTTDAPKVYYGLLACRCPEVHFSPAGAPDGSKPPDAVGCGSFWMATATLDPAREDMTIGPADVDVAYRSWSAARSVRDATSAALELIQANASRWQTSMMAVLGLLVITGLIGGRSVLETVDTWAQVLIGLFATLSLGSNVWSIFLLTAAASPRARLRPTGDLRQLQDADLEPLRQAGTAERRFSRALLLVVTSFSNALVALLLVWFAPPSDSPTLDVTIEVGAAPRSTCGTISFDRQAGTFTIIPRDLSDPSATFPISQLSGIGAPC